MKPRIMYIENKDDDRSEPARIGLVTFSKTGRTIYYNSLTFHRIKGGGIAGNHYEAESGDEYWISGPKKNGGDRLYNECDSVEVDEDIREEYWTVIRNLPAKRITPHIPKAAFYSDGGLLLFAQHL